MAVFQIQNKELSISVNSIGAELSSMKWGQQELLWQGDKNVWARHAPVLFPFVGKLKENKFTYEGKDYSMPQHGFARDREFILTEQSDNVLEFELTASEDSLKIYPFHFSLIIRYELKGNVLITRYIIFNPDNKDLLFSIGAHPGFNCNGMIDSYLEFENETLVGEKLKEGLLSGESYDLKLPNKVLPLHSSLFDNDALVFRDAQINKITLCGKNLPKIHMHCKDWPYFGIWSKKGCRDFICLEPWYGVADHVSHSGNFIEKEGVLSMTPHQSFTAEFSVEIE